MEKRYLDYEILENDGEKMASILYKEIEKPNYDIDYIKDLITYGHFDINESFNNTYFLIHACNILNLETVKLLLSEGANPNVVDSKGNSPIKILSNFNIDSNLSLQIKNAISFSIYQIFEELMKHPEINPNTENVGSDSPLLLSITQGHSNIFKCLLNHPKIDINYANSNLVTALMIAAREGRTQAIQELLKHPDTDLNLQSKSGYTALIIATREAKTQAVQELLKHPDIDPNLQDNEGWTALMWAMERGKIQAVQELLKHPKTKPNLQTEYGNTALMFATENGRTEAVQELLKHPSINVTLTNNDGKNAWDIAKDKIREQFPELNPITVLYNELVLFSSTLNKKQKNDMSKILDKFPI